MIERSQLKILIIISIVLDFKTKLQAGFENLTMNIAQHCTKVTNDGFTRLTHQGGVLEVSEGIAKTVAKEFGNFLRALPNNIKTQVARFSRQEIEKISKATEDPEFTKEFIQTIRTAVENRDEQSLRALQNYMHNTYSLYGQSSNSTHAIQLKQKLAQNLFIDILKRSSSDTRESSAPELITRKKSVPISERDIDVLKILLRDGFGEKHSFSFPEADNDINRALEQDQTTGIAAVFSLLYDIHRQNPTATQSLVKQTLEKFTDEDLVSIKAYIEAAITHYKNPQTLILESSEASLDNLQKWWNELFAVNDGGIHWKENN